MGTPCAISSGGATPLSASLMRRSTMPASSVGSPTTNSASLVATSLIVAGAPSGMTEDGERGAWSSRPVPSCRARAVAATPSSSVASARIATPIAFGSTWARPAATTCAASSQETGTSSPSRRTIGMVTRSGESTYS